MSLSPAYLTLPATELGQASKVPLEVLPNLDALYLHFARSIADEIRANNEAGQPTRLILPVGPVGQYPLLAQICNRERINWQSEISDFRFQIWDGLNE